MPVVSNVGSAPFTVEWDDGAISYTGVDLELERAFSALAGAQQPAVRYATALAQAVEDGLIRAGDDLARAVADVAAFRQATTEPDGLHGPVTRHEAANAARAARVRRLARLHPAAVLILAHGRHEPTLLAILDTANACPAAVEQARSTLAGEALADHRPIIRRHFRFADG